MDSTVTQEELEAGRGYEKLFVPALFEVLDEASYQWRRCGRWFTRPGHCLRIGGVDTTRVVAIRSVRPCRWS